MPETTVRDLVLRGYMKTADLGAKSYTYSPNIAPDSCIYTVASVCPMAIDMLAGVGNFVLEGCMYTPVAIGPIPGDYMEQIRVLAEAWADRPRAGDGDTNDAGEVAAGDGPVVDISLFLLKLVVYNRLI